MIEVRPATQDDLPSVILMAQAMHAETEFRFLGFDEAKLFDLGQRMIAEPNRCLFVAEDGELIGMIGGYVAEHFFSNDLLAHDQVLFVVPEHRGGRAALKLMQAFMVWSKQRKVRSVLMSTSSGMEHAERAGRFLRHFGLKQIGNVYRGLNHV